MKILLALDESEYSRAAITEVGDEKIKMKKVPRIGRTS
jgi:hypothetical protein